MKGNRLRFGLVFMIALLGKSALPATAQEAAETHTRYWGGTSWWQTEAAPQAALSAASAEEIAPAEKLTDFKALWAVYSWCRGSADLDRPGKIALVLRLPALETQACDDDALCSLPGGKDARPDGGSTILTSYTAGNAGSVFEACSCPPGAEHALGLPPAWIEGPSIGDVNPLACSIPWMETASPAMQFNAGAGVCFFSEVGGASLGHHNCFGQTMGVGASTWVGCTLPNGLIIEAFVSGCGAQRSFESGR